MSNVSDSIVQLDLVRAHTDAVCVGLSGGKDSLAVLDLCCRVFPRVEAFFQYFVDGLESVEGPVHQAIARHGVKLHKVPHWLLVDMYRFGVFRPHMNEADEWSAGKYLEVENEVRAMTGIDWIATGQRMDESLERRGMLSDVQGTDHKARRVYPLWKWSSRDVFAYLKARRIPPPQSFGKGARGVSGMNLSEPVLRFLMEQHPDDYAKVLEVFPFAHAQIVHADLYPTSEPPPK